jgi:hypothetical protein
VLYLTGGVGLIVLIIGGGSELRPYQMDILEQLEEEIGMNPYYGYSETFGSDWKVEKKLAHEEKVKGAQSYKKKNQRHPAFRK